MTSNDPVSEKNGVTARDTTEAALGRVEHRIANLYEARRTDEWDDTLADLSTIRSELERKDAELERLREERDAAQDDADAAVEALEQVAAERNAALAVVEAARNYLQAQRDWGATISAPLLAQALDTFDATHDVPQDTRPFSERGVAKA